jgi:general secretion pathway protein L
MLYDQYLAIDYGSRYIKGILFKNVLGTVTPIRFETLPKIHLNDEEGDEYEYNIIRFIQSFFPEESKFLVNLSIDRLFVRDLIIPLTSEKAVREIIPFEVENKLPFPTETMEVLGILSKIDQENSYVVTFNVQQDEISNVMNPFTRGDTRLDCLSVDSVALSSLFTKSVQLENTFIGQIHIGYDICIFNAVHKNKLFHTRSFHYGTKNLIDIVSEELKIDHDESENFLTDLSQNLFVVNENPEIFDFLKRRYKINSTNWKNIQKNVGEYISNLTKEIEKSIISLIEIERPTEIYISGGGSKFTGLDELLSKELDLPIKRYDFIEVSDPSYTLALATGYHYRLKSSDKIDFLTTAFARRQNKNTFKISNFLPHLIISGISLFILLTVFIFGIIIDKRKISQNQAVLVEKYKNGFGESPPEAELVISTAVSKLKAEQKKTEIFRLFLNKDSILDTLVDISEAFPDKETFPFILDQFTYDGNEVQIFGRVDEFGEIGTIEQAFEKSSKFKNIKILNKRLITGVTKFKVAFKIRLEVVSLDSE